MVMASALRLPMTCMRPCSILGGMLYVSRHTPHLYARSAEQARFAAYFGVLLFLQMEDRVQECVP